MTRFSRVTTFCSLVLAGMVVAENASADCSRATLQKVADTYVTALKAGDATKLPLAAGAAYAENNKALEAGKGVLAQAITIDFTRSFYDTKQCAAFTEVVAATNATPYVIHAHLTAAKNGKVSNIDTVVTHPGDWAFDATKYLGFTRDEKWEEIPKDKRDTREVIQAAADAYLNQWGDPALEVPEGTPCARLEGGMYTGTRNPEGNTCRMPAFPQKLNVGHRRYVIDETIGAVSVFNDFPWLDAGLGPDGVTPSGNQMRVEGGQIRYIHEVTVCSTDKCGRGKKGG